MSANDKIVAGLVGSLTLVGAALAVTPWFNSLWYAWL